MEYTLENSDVAVIIGSGAGGGTLSNALAQKGIDVVCLEAGPRLGLQDIVNNDGAMFGKLSWMDERIGEGDTIPGLPAWTCKTVGGTTMHWTAACPRLQEFELAAKSNYGDIEGANLADWPMPYSEMEDYYSKAEAVMGVTGTHGVPMLPGNNNYLVMEAGAKKIGYRDINTNHMAINPEARDGRPGCLQTGFCSAGCVIGAKWSTLYTEIPKAEATGNFELRHDCMVTRINTDEQGRATGVEYVDENGQAREQKARLVCVAGNTVETTRLLLNSGTTRFPDGLANSSDQVGRNYMKHVFAAVFGVMPGEVSMFKGAQIAGVIRDEIRHDPSRGFAGGVLYHTLPFGPETFMNLVMQGDWGQDAADVMGQYNQLAGLMVVGEDVPEQNNRITLHPTRKDQNGLPVPIVTYKDHKNTIAVREYGKRKAKELYTALGAERVLHGGMIPATHNMGVARIGEDPATSVCNPWGQTHDINNLFVSDGSLFPTSGCANPTLTIVTLALRQADFIETQVNAGSI
jgi:choline dehydrogenase-like flavoprotein